MDEAASKAEGFRRLGRTVIHGSQKCPLLLYPDQSNLSEMAKGVLEQYRQSLEGMIAAGDVQVVL
jgi:hypothetical protein